MTAYGPISTSPSWAPGSTTAVAWTFIAPPVGPTLAGRRRRGEQSTVGHPDVTDERLGEEGVQPVSTSEMGDAIEFIEMGEELSAWIAAIQAGDFVLDERYEDGHSAIEMYLTERTGGFVRLGDSDPNWNKQA